MEVSGIKAVALSAGSNPTLAITVNATARSSIFRVMGPLASCVYEFGKRPVLEIKPVVGLILKRLFADAGLRSEFTVSVPVPQTAKLVAIAAPVPPDEPPGVRVWSYGFIVCPPRYKY